MEEEDEIDIDEEEDEKTLSKYVEKEIVSNLSISYFEDSIQKIKFKNGQSR